MVHCRTELSDLTFGCHSNLQYLLMSECNLKSFDVNIPQPLKELHLGSNQLEEAPVHAAHPKSLRILRLDRNNIEKVKVKFAHNALEILDLSKNRIEEFELKFPFGDTNLKQLYLKRNLLKEVSM